MEPESKHGAVPGATGPDEPTVVQDNDARPGSEIDPGPTEIDERELIRSAHEGLLLLECLWPRGADAIGKAEADQSANESRFGRFRIVRELGRGGFGVVFLAIDPELGRPVALKVPRPEWLLDPPARERFLREARAIASLDHPGIAPLYEAGELHGVCYMASAYCEGPDLAAWLRERRARVAPRTAARIVAELADAVAHAHRRGVLHRDLKPANVLLARRSMGAGEDAEELSPRIVDFGLARLLDRAAEEVTASFAAVGTAPYMAPEQAEGKRVGPGGDVYGLGAVLYAMICRRPPHRGRSDLDTLRRVVTDDVVPPRSIRPDLSRDLEAICLKCLEKDPARRYASADDLREDLRRFLDGVPTLARSGARWARVRRTWRRHRLRLALAAILTSAGVAVLAGISRYEGRLREAVELARHRDEEAQRVRESARRARYIADLRHARALLDEHDASRAIAILDRNRPRPGEDDLREFSWRHLRRLCDSSRRTLGGFQGDVYWIEFSPRGDLLAAASKDGMVRVWETGSWQTVHAFRADRDEANVATFSPDGRSLATVGDEGTFRIWDLATGRPRLERPAHRGDAVVARFSPRGQTLITGGRNDGRIAIWNLDQGNETARFDAHPADFESATFSPDGRFLATSGSDRIRLWDLARRAMVAERTVPGAAFQGTAFSHDGRTLAVANRRVLLLNMPGLEIRRELAEHLDGVFAVAFSADDRTVFSGGQDGQIRGWDVSTGKLLWTRHGHAGKIWGLTLSPDGQTLASASSDGTVKLWDAGPPRDRDIVTIPGAPAAIRLSQDGHRIAVLDRDDRFAIRSADDGHLLESRDLLRTDDGPSPRSLIGGAIADDLRTVLMVAADGGVSAWDGERTRALVATASNTGTPIYWRLDQEGRRVLLLYFPVGRVECWEIHPARLLGVITGPYCDAYFLPDGRRAALAQTGWKSPVLWEPGVSELVSTPPGKYFNPACLAFSPNGRRLAHRDRESELGNHAIIFRETEQLSPLPTSIRCTVRLWSLAYDPTGRTLAGGGEDRRVRIWDVATGEELLTLDGLPGAPGHLQFVDDGRTLTAIVGRPDGSTEVSFWRTATIRE